MITINDCLVENFPFQEGDRVKIKWSVPHNRIDYGNITKLYKSVQWGKEIVHAIMVRIDGFDKDCVVCQEIITKIVEKPVQLKMF